MTENTRAKETRLVDQLQEQRAKGAAALIDIGRSLKTDAEVH